MLIDSDLDSSAIPSPGNYLMRPFSPSISLSYLDRSSYSFGGLFDLNKMIGDLDFDYKSLPSPTSEQLHHLKISELKAQILNIQNLYTKAVIEHENERKSFEETIKSLKSSKPIDKFALTFTKQIETLSNLTETVKLLQEKLKNFIDKP